MSSSAVSLMGLSAISHGFLMGTDGMRGTRPSVLRAQVGEGWRPTWPLPPTALTSDSHTVGFLAIRSSSSSVQLCQGSRRSVTSVTCLAQPLSLGKALLSAGLFISSTKAHLVSVRDGTLLFPVLWVHRWQLCLNSHKISGKSFSLSAPRFPQI